MPHARDVLAASLLLVLPSAAATLPEAGVEGMGVVSTAAVEVRAAISPDGTRIVWGSIGRDGGPGGWDLWEATRRDGAWVDPRPLRTPVNGEANDFDPAFSADGRWLYFFSNRPGGYGGDDLYRAAVREDGSYGTPENLGQGVNSAGDEWAPAPHPDGTHLLFASDGFGGAGRHDLFVARWDGEAFVDPRPVPGLGTAGDDFDAAWLGDGEAIVFARSDDVDTQPTRLWVARCDGAAYVDAQPLALALNAPDGTTLGPAVDPTRPGELLVSGVGTPHAGRLDILRVRAPAVTGEPGCVSAR